MISILAGAGASSAVNTTNYPTTAAFFTNLPEEITKLPLYRMLLRYYPEKRQQDVVDIEQVLWLISELRTVADTLSSAKQFPGWLMVNREVGTLQVNQANARHAIETVKTLANHANSLEVAIQRQVYELYHRAPAASELERTWIPLLTGLSSLSDPLELFTTNYDIVLETAIRQAQLNINTGRDPTLEYPLLSYMPWDSEPSTDPTRAGLLTKLHGSVHWKRGADGSVYVGDPTDRSRDSGNVIIYPGFKGDTLGEPFDMFHAYFQRCVRNSSVVIVIGYAFRDNQINVALRTHLQSHAALIVIDPAPQPARMPSLPEHRLKIVPRGFDAEAAGEVIAFARAHLQP